MQCFKIQYGALFAYIAKIFVLQIAMISPGMGSCDYTLNTLRYANRYCHRVLNLSHHPWFYYTCSLSLKKQLKVSLVLCHTG